MSWLTSQCHPPRPTALRTTARIPMREPRVRALPRIKTTCRGRSGWRRRGCGGGSRGVQPWQALPAIFLRSHPSNINTAPPGGWRGAPQRQWRPAQRQISHSSFWQQRRQVLLLGAAVGIYCGVDEGCRGIELRLLVPVQPVVPAQLLQGRHTAGVCSIQLGLLMRDGRDWRTCKMWGVRKSRAPKYRPCWPAGQLRNWHWPAGRAGIPLTSVSRSFAAAVGRRPSPRSEWRKVGGSPPALAAAGANAG